MGVCPDMVEVEDIATAIAENLSSILAPLQDALHYLTDGSPEDVRKRILVLFSLAAPGSRNITHLARELNVQEIDIKRLAKRGLIRLDGTDASLRNDGESLVALLFMMNKDVGGGTSEGILDLVQAAQAGSYKTDFIVGLVLGSGKRLAARMEATTRTDDLDHIEARGSDRKTAWQRIDKVLELLEKDLDANLANDLRAVSARLAKIGSNQQEVLTRIKTEDFRLPDGKQYSDLVRIVAGNSDDQLNRILASNPILRRRQFQRTRQLRYSESIKHQFAASITTDETEPEVALPTEGEQWQDQAFLDFKAQVLQLEDGALWHEVQQSPRSYLRGVWYAMQEKLPKRIREHGISLETTGDRIHEAPYLDVPVIIVRKQ